MNVRYINSGEIITIGCITLRLMKKYFIGVIREGEDEKK
jgi:hypothetical protein